MALVTRPGKTKSCPRWLLPRLSSIRTLKLQLPKQSTFSTSWKRKQADELFDEIAPNISSTKTGYSIGQKAFNKFAEQQLCKKLEAFVDQDCTRSAGYEVEIIKRLKQFATYLLGHKKADGKNIKPNCQTQYFSNAMNFLRTKMKKKLPTILK